MISNDGETIDCGSKFHHYFQKWETKTGKTMCEPVMWSEGEHILDEMEQARLCRDQSCYAFVRKDTFPIEMRCKAVFPDLKKYILGLDNGSVAICERR